MALDMGLATIIGAGITAGASGASAGVGSKMNKRARKDAKEARDWQSKESDKQRQWQEDMTKKSLKYQAAFDAYNYEKYNSPTARMAALKSAGLNPDLMYGSASGGNAVVPTGSSSSPSGSSPGSPAMPDYSSGTLMAQEAIQGIKGAASGYLDNELKRSQINNVDADTKVKGKSVQLMDSTIELQGIQGEYTNEQKKLIGAQITNLDAQVKHYQQAIEESKANTALINANKEVQQRNLDEMKLTFTERFNNIVYNNRKLLVDLDISKQDLEFLRRSMEDRLTVASAEAGIYSVEEQVAKAELALSRGLYDDPHDPTGRSKKVGFRILYEAAMDLQTGSAKSVQHMLEIAKRYDDAKAIVGILTDILNAAAESISAASELRGMGTKGATNVGTKRAIRRLGKQGAF